MSRIERKKEEKIKKLSRRPIYRGIFILTMVCIISGCIFLVDKEATLMIGKIDKYNIEVFHRELKWFIYENCKRCRRKNK
ncbi:hypothetical protein [Paraclostridium sp. AKS73]|uniref:hypothetical protein n=1 Tax=Paraclostridium sp. AKS73 TaxID=2876116 RepID=UPI0021E07F53|nr:hypothetical protein [Paraclostridium sp. AKS73]MCU9813985.1 hypothetical protein [Paraclostridium sp. AKS73]